MAILEGITYPESFKVFGSEQSKVIFCEADDWKPFTKHMVVTSKI